MDKGIIAFIFIVFLTGWISSNLYTSYSTQYDDIISFARAETFSPYDRIAEDHISLYDDKVIIKVENPTWARFADTNSMDPVIDIGANSIEIIPQTSEDVHIGDIVSYESSITDGYVIHRVIDIKEDSKGAYYVLKGDNNIISDPEKVRFSQIKGIVVAILY